jgi:type IX secretion system PorP/SprF family membrane protein
MKAIRIYLAILAVFLFRSGSMAQSDLLLSNSGMNFTAYNPAHLSMNGMINTYLLTRQQWIGFPDAPSLQKIGVDYFAEDRNMGFKFNFMNLAAGKEITRQASLSYMYRVAFSDQLYLGLGLSAGLYNRFIRFSELVFYDGNEPLIKPDESYLRPDFEFGFEVQWKDFSAGMAANHITTPSREATVFKIPVHNHLYVSYKASVAEDMNMNASVSWHQQESIRMVQLDARFIYHNIVFGGLGWRSNDALIIHAGMNFSEFVGIAYAYDIGITRFSNYNSGTHEFMLTFRFNPRQQTYLSPRFLD